MTTIGRLATHDGLTRGKIREADALAIGRVLFLENGEKVTKDAATAAAWALVRRWQASRGMSSIERMVRRIPRDAERAARAAQLDTRSGGWMQREAPKGAEKAARKMAKVAQAAIAAFEMSFEDLPKVIRDVATGVATGKIEDPEGELAIEARSDAKRERKPRARRTFFKPGTPKGGVSLKRPGGLAAVLADRRKAKADDKAEASGEK